MISYWSMDLFLHGNDNCDQDSLKVVWFNKSELKMAFRKTSVAEEEKKWSSYHNESATPK